MFTFSASSLGSMDSRDRSAVVWGWLVTTAAIGWVLAWPTVVSAQATKANTSASPLEQWVTIAEQTVPADAANFSPQLSAKLDQAAEAIELWVIQRAASVPTSPQAALDNARGMLDAKRRIDRLLQRTLNLRNQLVTPSSDQPDRERLRSYLRCASRLIDLSGRLRYLQFDALTALIGQVVTASQDRLRLVRLLSEYESTAGAAVAVTLLVPAGKSPPSEALVSAVLDLLAAAGDPASLPAVAKLLKQPFATPETILRSAETIQRLGLPQPARLDTPADLPRPALTPADVRAALARLATVALPPQSSERYKALCAWVDERAQVGLTEPRYRHGKCEVQPGDWLLIRNPSPYNLFTDLSPGLFTHVGVVALEQGTDGIRRMVVVDLPERGTRMPATNVEIFLERSLHYVFLRHDDPQAAAAMGSAAQQTIGNEIEFDLNFRTDRVLSLARQPLGGKRIKTYCAGFLLLCALQTELEWREFFPVVETAAGGQTSDNIAQLGMSIGADFVSPTGALFSPRLQVVGSREPMYDPAREIEEAVFDYFAARLSTERLRPTNDLFHQLRIKVAEASQSNRLLAEALAATAGVNAQMDLVSAAKAAAVVATLDEIAFGRSAEFNLARDSIRGGAVEALRRLGVAADKLAAAEKYRRRHADLVAEFEGRRLSPRQLRVKLVNYYAQAGRADIDRRFFAAE